MILKCALLLVLLGVSLSYASQCGEGTVWSPQAGTSWYWQLQGDLTTQIVDNNPVEVYDFDMFNITTDLINYIHALNRTVICYIDTAYEPNRPDSSRFTSAVLGSDLQGWPGQKWVDIRSSLVRQIMYDRLLIAASKGCDAIEWDDVDGYSNEPGFPFTDVDQLVFNVYLSNITHAHNMSVGLKNDVDQAQILLPYFEFAINEQCFEFGECVGVLPFLNNNKAVFAAEYKGTAAAFCPFFNVIRMSGISANLGLNGAPQTRCCSFAPMSCLGIQPNCIQPAQNYPTTFQHQSHPSSSSTITSSFVYLVVVALLLSFWL